MTLSEYSFFYPIVFKNSRSNNSISQELDLSYNQIEVLDLNFINPALTKLVCTHCSVMKVITKVSLSTS